MTPTQMDRKTFLANLRQSGLLSREEIRAVKARLPESNRGRVIARALVGWGLLTKFQAELLLAGRTHGFLLGQYRILDQIGHGGMGRVFKAVHQTMNRVVAIKVLAPQLVRTEKAQQLFQREVRAAARLIHPNIVTAYDANQIGDRHYLVMEYVDGPNLDQLARARGPLPVGLACDLVRQVAAGLQYAFEMGMVHRDIKPANILVQPGPTPASPCVAKILDFGLARLQDGDTPAKRNTILTRPNVVMGTPDYLSPEQSKDLHAVDIRSDLYSLGCTLYYLLTRKVPFPGGSSLEKLLRHGTEEAVPVEQHRPDLPAGVAQIVRRLLAKAAADRFQTPAELAAALAPFAVPGPSLWTGPAPERSLDTTVATPSNIAADLGALPPAQPSNSGSALAGTVGVDQSATPLSSHDMTTPFPWHHDAGRSSRRWVLVLGVVGLVLAGLTATAVWLLFQ